MRRSLLRKFSDGAWNFVPRLGTDMGRASDFVGLRVLLCPDFVVNLAQLLNDLMRTLDSILLRRVRVVFFHVRDVESHRL